MNTVPDKLFTVLCLTICLCFLGSAIALVCIMCIHEVQELGALIGAAFVCAWGSIAFFCLSYEGVRDWSRSVREKRQQRND